MDSKKRATRLTQQSESGDFNKINILRVSSNKMKNLAQIELGKLFE